MRQIDPADVHYSEVHRLMLSGIAPRPIALAGTIDAEGRPNLSPFSFFNAFGANPPVVAFSPAYRGTDGTPKHSFLNVKETGEFTISVVSYAMLEQMNLASAEYPEGVDEYEKAGFSKLPSRYVRPFGVAQSPMVMECKLLHHIDFGALPAGGNMLIGQVVMFHIRESVFEGKYPTPDRLDLVARMGGPYYCRARGSAVFSLAKPAHPGIGFDMLPPEVRHSDVLTGNDLGRLAGVAELPTDGQVADAIAEIAQEVAGLQADDLGIELSSGSPSRALAALRSHAAHDPRAASFRRELHRISQLYIRRDEPLRAWHLLLASDEQLETILGAA